MVWILGVLVLVAGAYCVGYFLPQTLTGSSEKSVVYPPEQVFAAVMDAKNFPVGADLTKQVEPLSETRWREDIGTSKIEVETVEAQSPGRVVRTYRDLKMPMTAVTEVLIAPSKTGSYIAMKTDITLVNGHVLAPVLRILMMVFRGADKGVDAYLGQLEKGLNQGLVPYVPPLADQAAE